MVRDVYLPHLATPDYRNGLQIYSSHKEKAIFQCNCDSSDDRKTLLRILEDTIGEVGGWAAFGNGETAVL